jgi:quercetin dioxygenase-like cupin family protein
VTSEPIRSAEEARPWVSPPDAYREWQQAEGVPIVTGFYIEDLNGLELAPWTRKGGRGAIVNLAGTGGVNDAHVVEIEPGKASEPEHHLYEAMVYVLAGRGSTAVWYEGQPKHTFEWGAGSLFAIPLNAWYQHFNGSGSEVARYVAVTNLPTILKLFHNRQFVFDNPFAFMDRFSGESGYFSGDGTLYQKQREHVWQANFVPNVRDIRLYEWKDRGVGNSFLLLELAQNSMGAHISSFKPRMYKKAHRHGPGAHVIILDGTGYSVLWKNPDDEKRRCDWKPGSVVVPPEDWFHQHFNTGPRPARYLALRMSGMSYEQPAQQARGQGAAVSLKLGGWQIEYEDEDPDIHQTFEAELARHGVVCSMKDLVPWCTGEQGATRTDGVQND